MSTKPCHSGFGRITVKMCAWNPQANIGFQCLMCLRTPATCHVVSDTFGKSSMNIINKLMDNPADNNFDIEPLIHKSRQSKLLEPELAIHPRTSRKIKVIRGHHRDLESCQEELWKCSRQLSISVPGQASHHCYSKNDANSNLPYPKKQGSL
jgi:hypothetical protein